MSNRINILIAEPSLIIRCGLIAVLKQLPSLDVKVAELVDMSNLLEGINRYQPDVLIVDPSYIGVYPLNQLRGTGHSKEIKIVALLNKLTDKNLLQVYDAVISIYDSPETMREIFVSMKDDDSDIKMELSPREKEIVVCVVKGMTNKQIAEQLCLSTHTIMTHRRNISSKLQIHSPAGLTIYAIVNKLVDINDVKNTIIMDDDNYYSKSNVNKRM